MANAESTAQRETFRDEPFFLFENAGWELYDRLDAWASERRGTKLTYIDGDVVIVAKSRRHYWFALRLYDVIWALASAAGIVSEDAGATTFCLREREAGAEADQSFFFGQNAVRMAGPKDFEPGTDPVPDMVVEVDAGHSITRRWRAGQARRARSLAPGCFARRIATPRIASSSRRGFLRPSPREPVPPNFRRGNPRSGAAGSVGGQPELARTLTRPRCRYSRCPERAIDV